MLRKIFKILLVIVGCLLIGLVMLIAYVRMVSVTAPPIPPANSAREIKVTTIDSGLSVAGNNWFRRSESGLYELYVEGTPFERGVAIGALSQDLVQNQEKVFNDQIEQIIPSSLHREALRYFIGWFNRDLSTYVPEEYQLEIYGISLFSSHQYDAIAQPYQRLLNYHGAHDIGHALQNMSLVGCTSFATWGSDSEDSTLIIGRNFDFYVGDDFAQNKIVAFYKPDKGHKFMMITFGGMIGVLSGMNSEGLTVTINAAKSDIPSSAATPVSIVAREILQYASTIEEAYQIAQSRKMFVAESFLIGSAKDGRAAIIEKSNDSTALYDPSGSHVVCTNHFQSETLGATTLNRDHMATSASPYRYNRVEELLHNDHKNNVEKTISILRNQKGLEDSDIGLGNEKAINQLIAHHGIVFQPDKKLVWVSTAPWQLGKFVCYDLNKVFKLEMTANTEIYERALEVRADSFLLSHTYQDFVKFNPFRLPFSSRSTLNPDSIVAWNSNSYHALMMAGDYYFSDRDFKKAKQSYELSLTKEIATTAERDHIAKNLNICIEELK
jgi:isopenicillin-N N-acyltransferase-like protein